MRLVTAFVMLLPFATVGPAGDARAQGGGCLHSEQEPNDTPATANPITPGNFVFSIYGSIAVPGDVDWYVFSAAPGSRLWLSVDTGVASAGSRDSVVSIFAADGTTLVEEDDDDGTGNGRNASIESLEASLIAGRVLPGGFTYYARVRAKTPTETNDGYSLLVSVSTQTPVPEIEPNNGPPCYQQAWGLIAETLSSSADTDCYAVNVLDNGFPFIVVDGDPERDGFTTDVTVRFADYTQGTITTNSSGAGSASNPPAEGFAVQFGGNAYVTGTGPGTYTLAVFWSGIFCSTPVTLHDFAIE